MREKAESHQCGALVIESARMADALSARWAVARALGSAHSTSVEAKPVPVRYGTKVLKLPRIPA
jgi:hypothetical protein